MFFYPLLKSLLFYFDAELAHRITINLLKTYQIKNSIEHQSLKSNIFGLNFPNPVGLAAGFDKNSEVPKNILNLGFGFSVLVQLLLYHKKVILNQEFLG